jgi:flagellar basal body rod protein FlgB
VDVDQQMAKLAENNLMFQAGIQSLIKKFEALKVSVTETR